MGNGTTPLLHAQDKVVQVIHARVLSLAHFGPTCLGQFAAWCRLLRCDRPPHASGIAQPAPVRHADAFSGMPLTLLRPDCPKDATSCSHLNGCHPRPVNGYQFVLAVNAHRRASLNQQQKRSIIEAYLRGDPGIADHTLAQSLGVSKNTVATVRDQLESTCQIDKLAKTRGKDGKARPVKATSTHKKTEARHEHDAEPTHFAGRRHALDA